MKLKKGILIVFEGIDGSGKSTQAEALLKRLEEKGLDVTCFQEPSRGRWGQEIKAKAALEDSLTPEEELELFLKDRAENVEKNLKPALAKKKVVILDRYYFSTIAYQGAKGIDTERIRALNERFVVKPDMVFILDVEVEKGLDRIQDRKNKDMLFERHEYLVEVRRIFKNLRGDNILHIDGGKNQEEIGEQIAKIVLDYVDRFIIQS